MVALPGTDQAVRGYPALVDEGATVGRAGARDARRPSALAMAGGHAAAARCSACPPRCAPCSPACPTRQRLSLAGAPHESVGAVLADATTAALDALIAEAGGPAWDPAGFARLRGHVAGRLAAKTGEVVAAAVRILDARREVERRLETVGGAGVRGGAAATSDRQLARLVPPGFIARTGAARLPDVERYLQAAARRLERLPDATAVDRDRMRAVHELEAAHRQRLESLPRGRPVPEGLREVPGCSRSCGSASSPRASGPAGRCPRSGSAGRSTRPPHECARDAPVASRRGMR